MKKYSDYCVAFYHPEENTVYFYDEIKDRVLGKEKVAGKEAADAVMQIWQDNAPENVICHILKGWS